MKKSYLTLLLALLGFNLDITSSEVVPQAEIFADIDAMQLEEINKQNETNKMNRDLIRIKKQVKEDNKMLFAQEAKIQKLEEEIANKDQVIQEALNNPSCKLNVPTSNAEETEQALKMDEEIKRPWSDE